MISMVIMVVEMVIVLRLIVIQSVSFLKLANRHDTVLCEPLIHKPIVDNLMLVTSLN